MPKTYASVARRNRYGTDLAITGGLTAVILFFAISGFVAYFNIKTISEDNQALQHTHEVMSALDEVSSSLRDAETGQRGYIISGDEKYLTPYNAALPLIDERIDQVQSLTADNPDQQAHIPIIRKQAHDKLDELALTITLRREQGFDAARTVVVTDRGKIYMDELRSQIDAMKQNEVSLRKKRIAELDNARQTAITSGILSAAAGIVLSIFVAFLISRASRIRLRQQWLQSGQVGLSTALVGEQRVEQLGESILKFSSDYFGAAAGAMYTKDGAEYRRVATFGVPNPQAIPERFEAGNSLLGQAAKDGRAFILSDIPDDYLKIGSALGNSKPRHLVIAPASVENVANAVIELGFLQAPDPLTMQLMEAASESISISVRSANYRASLRNLLEETQRQAEELQTQSEELRVTNEELEEQSRALKASQAHLEQQQAELEQTNSQLEEQTQQLETQRDDLNRAHMNLQTKAREVEQASQYKSDFLANMSHELRTPLNSSLILAKLLADNTAGNLTEEQVKYAQTIQSSGNDLLTLINDILDLSKIEAGRMEIQAETVTLARLNNDLARMFKPIAEQKGLRFETNIDVNCPETMVTDRQRLEQVLKNLVSNAIKFTEKGGIELSATRTASGSIAFAVKDTGIGISPDQQQIVFDAFRQADSNINRKYGGTGLGLSISRELARLLGGTIDLVSVPGNGSTFTVTVPVNYDPKASAQGSDILTKPHEPFITPSASPVIGSNKSDALHLHIPDDRENLASGTRVILVVEDDPAFAKILYGMAHELNFRCLVASTAEEGLSLARQYIPHAVVLDVNLPDNSGLTVLDRLKRNARTRHIPVHVVSAHDHTQTAMSLGAVGYMFKPVRHDELAEALKRLETKLEQRIGRVLIVEDDKVQMESVCKLLGSRTVETVGVGTAAECLDKLKEQTFDCMVLDLSLPDSSGYALLETLSREDAYSFPPVIVYTGRDISADEEQQLQRYSKSIIIKGAKSPERLLDEVTLFLHQVVAELPSEQQAMLEKVRNRDDVLENRNILVVEDDVRNVYALTSVFEPRGAVVHIARNGKEALKILEKCMQTEATAIDLILMDVMMPEMDGLTATREIRKRPEWKKLPVIMLTAKAMKDDQEKCLESGANDYMAKPLDVEKLLSLVRVWMPR